MHLELHIFFFGMEVVLILWIYDLVCLAAVNCFSAYLQCCKWLSWLVPTCHFAHETKLAVFCNYRYLWYICIFAGEQVSSWYARELWVSDWWAKHQSSMSHCSIPTSLPGSSMQSYCSWYGLQRSWVPKPWEPYEKRKEGSSEQVLGVKEGICPLKFWCTILIVWFAWCMNQCKMRMSS